MTAFLRRSFFLSVAIPTILALPACVSQWLDQLIPVFLSAEQRVGVFVGPPVYTEREFVNWESPHVSPLAITPDGATLLAVNTADQHLEILDARGEMPKLAARVAVGLDPVSVRLRTPSEAWVVNHVSDSVSIVDLSTAAVARTLNVGDEPTDVAFAGGSAFVVCSQINEVWVYSLADLDAVPRRVSIVGEDPRMIVAAADGAALWVTVFESGNATTILPIEIVEDPSGPYGGVNPPPFATPQRATDLAPGPRPSLIVRRDASGRWRDDNGADWTELVPWQILDHDLARIDSRTLEVEYVGGLMNLDMALALRPDGALTVIGTDARNEVRFEPNLRGDFVRSLLAQVTPGAGATLHDLNPHLESILAAGIRTLPIAERSASLADPRGIAWRSDGASAYVTGMGSNNVIRIHASGARTGVLDVGAGPTGICTDDATQRVFVLNKFDADISVIDAGEFRELGRVALSDPTPAVIREGRKFLYDARLTSGLGVGSCGACHIDGRMDQVAWDLGNPAGAVAPFDQQCDSLLGPLSNTTCDDFHPMKGPMTTQTLQGIIGTEPLHWRGDRQDLAAFNPAFVGLLGNDRMLTPAELAQFEAFIATLTFPPNPYRNADGTFQRSVFGGDAARGFEIYVNEPIDSAHAAAAAAVEQDGGSILQRALLETGPILTCNRCHELWSGTNRKVTPGAELGREQGTKIPQLRNVYEKSGFSKTGPAARGFGLTHNGQFADAEEFLRLTNFDFGGGRDGDQKRTDVIAFVLSMTADTPAGVGQQVTLLGADSAAEAERVTRVVELQRIADLGEVALIARGRGAAGPLGFVHVAGGEYVDARGEQVSLGALQDAARDGAALTWTLVPRGMQTRMAFSHSK